MTKKAVFFCCLAVLTLAALPASAQGPTVTITGPTSVTIDHGCQDVMWTANPAGGQTPYVFYEWTRNGGPAGSGAALTSITRQYCSVQGVCQMFTDVIGVTVADFNGREGVDTHNTGFTLRGCDANGMNCAC